MVGLFSNFNQASILGQQNVHFALLLVFSRGFKRQSHRTLLSTGQKPLQPRQNIFFDARSSMRNKVTQLVSM